MMTALLSNLLALAHAEGAAPAAPAGGGLMQLVPFALVFAIFYFLMLRPQKKRLVEEQAMLNALNKGDEVYTKSGLLGTIAGLTEKIVTLEVSEGVKLKVLRSQVAGLAKKLFETPEVPAKK